MFNVLSDAPYFLTMIGQSITGEDLDDSDDEFPALNRLPKRFKRKSCEDGSDAKTCVEDSDKEVLSKDISSSQESVAGSSSGRLYFEIDKTIAKIL